MRRISALGHAQPQQYIYVTSLHPSPQGLWKKWKECRGHKGVQKSNVFWKRHNWLMGSLQLCAQDWYHQHGFIRPHPWLGNMGTVCGYCRKDCHFLIGGPTDELLMLVRKRGQKDFKSQWGWKTKAAIVPSRHKRSEVHNKLTDTGSTGPIQVQVRWGLSMERKSRHVSLFLTQKLFATVNSSQRKN